METTILYIFIRIIEALILWWYASNLFDSKYSKKIEFLGFFISYGCLFLILHINSFWINTISFALINFTIIILLYNTKWNIGLLHSIITTAVMCFSELAIIVLFSHSNETAIYFPSGIKLWIIITILSKALYFIVLRIVVILTHGSIYETGYTNKATALLNIIPLIFIYIYFVFTYVLLSTSISAHYRYMISFCSILLLLVCVLTFYVYHYTQQKNRKFTELQIQLQKEYDMTEYYKTLFAQNENQQILIHDIRKHLMAISQLNDQNEQSKISRYLDTLLNSSDLQNYVHVSDNELLNSILCHYMQICQIKHIAFKVDVRKKLLQHLEYSELTALFCNLLDNAVEACSDIPDSYIDLSITDKENTDITVISIINTCRNYPKFNKNGIPLSTKKNKLKHGFGLKSVERIVNKYNGNMKMYFDDDKMLFHTIITIKRINKNF